jgi:hypothetical protein
VVAGGGGWSVGNITDDGYYDDLWGETWTYSDINSANFGIAVSFTSDVDRNVSKYITIQDFGFALPSTAIIQGITVNFLTDYATVPVGAQLRYVAIGVQYADTALATSEIFQWEATVPGFMDYSGSSVNAGTMLIRTLKPSNGTLTIKAEVISGSIGQTPIYGPWQVRYYIVQETAAA